MSFSNCRRDGIERAEKLRVYTPGVNWAYYDGDPDYIILWTSNLNVTEEKIANIKERIEKEFEEKNGKDGCGICFHFP